MKNSIHIATAVGVWALLLGGCGNFSAKPDPSRFFTLSALPAPEDAAKKTSVTRRGFLWALARLLCLDISIAKKSSLGWRRTKSIWLKMIAGRNLWKKISLGSFHKMSQLCSAPIG